MKVTVENPNTGRTERYSLPKQPIFSGRVSAGTGVWVEAVYVGRKTGRVIIEMDSSWVNDQGGRTGTFYRLAESLDDVPSVVRDEVAETLEAYGFLVPEKL